MSDTSPEDLGAPLRNGAVEEAMRNVALHDAPESRSLLFRLLLESTLLALSPEPLDRPQRWIARDGEPLNLVTSADADGIVLPLFTDENAILRSQPQGSPFIALPSRAVFEMAVANGTNKIVLNPGSPTSGFVTRREMEALAHGRLPLGATEVIAEEEEVRVGKPATPPPVEAIDALRVALGREPLAVKAWYFLMQQGAEAPELMVAVQFRADISDDERAGAMRSVVEDAGARSGAVGSLLFLIADEPWRARLEGGSGVELFRR